MLFISGYSYILHPPVICRSPTNSSQYIWYNNADHKRQDETNNLHKSVFRVFSAYQVRNCSSLRDLRASLQSRNEKQHCLPNDDDNPCETVLCGIPTHASSIVTRRAGKNVSF